MRLSSATQCLLSWSKVSPAEGVVYEAQVKTTPTGGYQKVCPVIIFAGFPIGVVVGDNNVHVKAHSLFLIHVPVLVT